MGEEDGTKLYRNKQHSGRYQYAGILTSQWAPRTEERSAGSAEEQVRTASLSWMSDKFGGVIAVGIIEIGRGMRVIAKQAKT